MVKRVATAVAVKEIKKAAKELDNSLKKLRQVLNPDIVVKLEATRDQLLTNAAHVENNARDKDNARDKE